MIYTMEYLKQKYLLELITEKYKTIITMWIRTINGIVFIPMEITSQGLFIPKK